MATIFKNMFFKSILCFMLIFTGENISAQTKTLDTAFTGNERPALHLTSSEMMVRISEIEILPEYLDEYKSILKEESAQSLKIEPGVISLFAMYENENPVQVRIVEIYASKKAYQSHLKTPHFQHYKTNTLKMVKSLKLVDMTAIDQQSMSRTFKKLK